ncbi:hypothetical protein ACJX0J_021037, partial [Zea mays]
VKNLLDTSDPFSHDLPNKVDGYVLCYEVGISDTLHHVENRSFYSQLLYICVLFRETNTLLDLHLNYHTTVRRNVMLLWKTSCETCAHFRI